MSGQALNSAAGGRPPAARVFGPDWRERRDVPVYSVGLWPNQSLGQGGYRFALWIAAAGVAIPMSIVAGTPAFWGLLPFAAGTVLALRYALRRNRRDLRYSESLEVWPDEIRVVRHEAGGRCLRWQAEPMRVRVRLHGDGPVEDYLTLTGGGREIELGAFLSPEERVSLAAEIEAALTRAIRR